MSTSGIKSTIAALGQKRINFTNSKMVIGFDGFVDEIIHMVSTRHNKNTYDRIQTIEDFGRRILSAAGKSANMEMVPIAEKVGGNGPLMAMAAAGMGGKITCIGLMGKPDILPVFWPLKDKCAVYSVGNPGHTDALEFKDGKLMMGKLNTLPQVNWQNICAILGQDTITGLINEADMVACTNWTMLTEMKGIIEEFIKMSDAGCSTRFFFDLADPEKRPREELKEVLSQVRRLNENCECIMGLNLREVEQITAACNLDTTVVDNPEGLQNIASVLMQKLEISGVVIHSVKHAAACLGHDSAGVSGPYCSNPKITTGAGDHFNGGFCSALLAGLGLEEALYTGVGNSGWYVRHMGEAPSLDDIIGLLHLWDEGSYEL